MKKTTPGIVPTTALAVNESTRLTTPSLEVMLMSTHPFFSSPFWPPRWENEPECWNEFYQTAKPVALDNLARDHALANDAVMIAANECMEKYAEIEVNPKSWCLAIVKRRSQDLWRQRNPKSLKIDFHSPLLDDSQGNSTPNPLVAAADQASAPDQEMKKTAAQALVGSMIDSLPPADRHVFISRYIKEQSQAEIADRLRRKENAIKCQLKRIRIKLRKKFSEKIAAFLISNN